MFLFLQGLMLLTMTWGPLEHNNPRRRFLNVAHLFQYKGVWGLAQI